MNCKLCNKPLRNVHHRSLYCGHRKTTKTCAWKVSKLQTRLVSIKERCLNKSHKNYHLYKDVKICRSWMIDSFGFVLWALSNGWDEDLQIDRIDNDKGYRPSNCRFVTRSENMRNKRKTVTDWDKKIRRCRVCKRRKPFRLFMVSRKEIGGIAYECKSCRKQISKNRWRKQNDT